jgi:hypothetical protein
MKDRMMGEGERKKNTSGVDHVRVAPELAYHSVEGDGVNNMVLTC